MSETADSPQKPYLSILDLTKMFGDFTALKDISLDIFEGEFVCFLGPSGCGKTTLLRAIAGLDIQTSGRIEQADRDISALPPSERDFGIVFQSYALFPNLTVLKNVSYGLDNKKMPKDAIASRVTELLDLVGMPEQGDKYPAQLSGGQQQRVALARALATSPGLLLLDEPLSALDAKVRVHLRHEVKQLQHKLGVTTIMVTHDQEEALTMADRIVVMNQGVIEQIGTPTDIYRSPISPFVADFVGTMNFLPAMASGNGTVSLGGAKLTVDEGMDGFDGGEPVTLSFRPEDVNAREMENGNGNGNSLQTHVASLEFLGSFYRAGLSIVDDGDTVFTADFSVNLIRDLGIAEGSSLTVALPAEQLRVYSRDS
ncbi:MAG: putative 2-aminoethylphosphonate ABC transporter ATP-binding protein [Rhodospirillales bacterium]|nr:putative 2-aminoethylphosphonate ABC transporter ATP-binding protein [Rhodospirillales bacterium]